MTGIKVRARVFLCPYKDHAENPVQPTWPHLAGITIKLVKAEDPSAQPIEVTTVVGDRAQETNLELGVAYTPTVISPGWSEWEPSRPEVTVEERSGRQGSALDVILIPRSGRRLLALRLVRDTENGPPVKAAKVQISSADETFQAAFPSRADGHVYCVAPTGEVTLRFGDSNPPGEDRLLPRQRTVQCSVPERAEVGADTFIYVGAVQILMSPVIAGPAGQVALTGAKVTVVYQGPASVSEPSDTKELLPGQANPVAFEYSVPGTYAVTVSPPPAFDGWPVENKPVRCTPQYLRAGETFQETAVFESVAAKNINGVIRTPDSQQLDDGVRLVISSGPDVTIPKTTNVGDFEVQVPSGVPLEMQLDPVAGAPTIDEVPLEMSTPGPTVVQPSGRIEVDLQYQHAIMGEAVDDQGHPMPFAVIDVFDEQQQVAASVAADDTGHFIAALRKPGNYFVAMHTEDGEPVTRTPVTVRSIAQLSTPLVLKPPRGSGQGGSGAQRVPREAVTDLASYPVLTEEVSTTGVPAPVAGGTGGTAGAAYGQAVDQVIRDVLGWRPGGDVAGFQAALSGAFQLRDVEGHTAWTWQQRGYAVQADMGALRGAQASIYARAKNALGQMQPLLAGITALNPALYPPQDLEAIRTVIAAELDELVNELALEGGPRIQRVNELFRMLTGGSRRSPLNPNPDVVQGQLGTMRDRFGLTEAYVDTVDEEGILTNFRIVVEQVLDLQESWYTDRKLLSVLDSNSALGTILIWLSRSLEAVCESVDDLTFALDSVFVDAAQRQVIQLMFRDVSVEVPALPLRKREHADEKLHDDAPLLLSDLLDWVVRACRDEGPRMVQDAGRDGVEAFAPVLNKLRILIYATRKFTHSGATFPLPDGMRTPRVRRALEVLAAQLDEAADLAHMVKQSGVPEITSVQVSTKTDATTKREVTTVAISGVNFRRNATAFLIPENRADLPDVPAQVPPHVTPPSLAKATFRIPHVSAAGGKVAWQVVIANEDGTQSDPVAI